MSDEQDVRYAVADGIATLTLDRPERMNTISHAMLDRLASMLTRANADAAVRVVILTATGRAFCAGLDLNEAVDGDGIGASGTRHPPTIDLRSAPPTVLFAMDKPVICALNGSAAGYGMDLAIGCDIRIMAEGAKLAPAFVKRGIVPESGGTWLLPRMIGWAKAAELIFTGRTLDAAESLSLGLVNHVVPDAEVVAVAERIAREIAANAPLAVQASKRMMRMGLNETFETHVQHVYLQLLPLFASDDFQEGMRSFLEKRPASFNGR
ncbi:enoyl-CoA hydratase/isomerase family protein [Sphingomonas sp. Mn802worker]|uniref:enoyl-CoA hydratase/isomerase family protein n=1 Tax=Sphingomonas sp. Mn802worker TaxID=629773 RepID=UPI0003A1ED52|nr:enoyl-CoA hydratase/isomerase family protein [Sphingomonas sp. Mn802worker]